MNWLLRESPGTFLARIVRTGLHLYLREDPFRMTRYPRQLPIELKLPTWDRESVLLTALLVRVNRNDFTTFLRWINCGYPPDLQIVQALSKQESLELNIVAEGGSRLIPLANCLKSDAELLLNKLRARPSWSPDQFAQERRQVDTLYPSAASAWWAEKRDAANARPPRQTSPV